MTRCSSVALMIASFAFAPACTDSEPESIAPEGPGWESATTTTDDGKIVIQKVAYRANGLRIVGQVCRPAGTGPFPLIVSNHAGFQGLPAWNGGECAEAARRGFVQIESAFRGQDGSSGTIEICLGEVDDTLAMLDIALAMPEIDPNRVVMRGTGHGGCVTARALQRGAAVKAAASVSGISDLPGQYAFWSAQALAGSGPQYDGLVALANETLGGAPDDYPDEYRRRSPIEYMGQLPTTVPFLITHLVEDKIVPTRQSCDLAQRLGLKGHHYDEQHELVATAPAGCEASWAPSVAEPTSWTAARYLVVYEGEDGAVMESDVDAFLSAKLR